MSNKVFKPRLIPQDWCLKKISDIAKTGSGGTPLSTCKDYYIGGDIPWINSGEVGQNSIKQTTNFITKSGLQNSSAKMFPTGSVLIALYGATAGKTSFLEIDATTNQAICAIMPKNGYDAKFIKYYLDVLYSYLVGVSTGSARDNLNQNGIQDLEIPFPSEITQKSIAKVLSDLDAKIELNNKINQELEAMAKTIYDYWFVQFDFPDANGKPYKLSGGKMVYNKELKREIPVGWVVRELGKEIEIQRGISYKSSEINGKGTPMISLNSFNLNGTYKESGIKMYSGKYSNKNLAKEGDLLIAVTDVTRNADIIGKAILVPDYYDDLVFSMDIAKVIPKENLTDSYLMMLFNSEHYHNYIKWFASGTIVLHLNMDGMKWYKAELPPKHILDKFDSMYKVIAKRIAETTKQNNKLSELRDWLLPMLMNGQVTVGEANEQLGMVAEQKNKYEKR